MKNDLWSSESCKLTGLTRCTTNWYTETSVVNSLKDSVVMIDRHGNKTVIPPSSTNGAYDNTVTILKRSNVGPSISPNGEDLQLQGMQIKIMKHALRNEPVYIEPLDCLLCTEEQAVTAKHPFAALTYSEAVENCLDHMADRLDTAPGIHLLANDPTGSFDVVYTLVDNAITCVPVSHEPSENFILTIVTYRDGKAYADHLDLTPLIKGTENTIKFTDRFIPWVTTNKLQAENLAREFRWITVELFNEAKNKQQIEFKAILDSQKSSYDAKLQELGTLNTGLKSDLARAEQERDEFKQRYLNLKADAQLRVDQLQQEAVIAKSRNDVNISDNNAQQAAWKMQSAEKESNFKVAGMIAAAALPVLGILALELFKNAAKR